MSESRLSRKESAEPHPLCARCRHPLWAIAHYWQCGWRDQSYNFQGQKK